MRITETIQVEAHEETVDYLVCDTCGKRFLSPQTGVKKCHICGNHVCKECATKTDYWYLEPNSFAGDYPDYYCPSCWAKGKYIREAISNCRLTEEKLWTEWHEIVGKTDKIEAASK
jgi:hypothetical protein